MADQRNPLDEEEHNTLLEADVSRDHSTFEFDYSTIDMSGGNGGTWIDVIDAIATGPSGDPLELTDWTTSIEGSETNAVTKDEGKTATDANSSGSVSMSDSSTVDFDGVERIEW